MNGVRNGQYHPVAHVKYKILKTASPAELKLFRDGKYLDCPPASCHTPGVGGQINVATDPRDANVHDYTSGNGFGDIYLKKDVKAGEELLVGSYHWGKTGHPSQEVKGLVEPDTQTGSWDPLGPRASRRGPRRHMEVQMGSSFIDS